MSSQSVPKTIINLPAESRVIRAFGDEMILHLDGKQTGGKLTLWTEVTPPGGGPPSHYHLNEEEWFVVQQGQIQFFTNGKWQDVPEGGCVFTPRNSVHTFKNVGVNPSRMLISTSPSGFETFFTRCAEEFAKPGGPDKDRIVKISAEHGIHYVK